MHGENLNLTVRIADAHGGSTLSKAGTSHAMHATQGATRTRARTQSIAASMQCSQTDGVVQLQ